MSDDEPLEVFDAEGRPSGAAKTRAAIHRDGNWHLAFFCWVFRGGREVVLQKRAATKDVWPGRFDASAAGHVRFGETMEDASREIDEELGIRPAARELVPVMRHRQEHAHASGLVDREIHDVHVLWWAAPLGEYPTRRLRKPRTPSTRVERRWRGGSARGGRCRGGSRRPPRGRR